MAFVTLAGVLAVTLVVVTSRPRDQATSSIVRFSLPIGQDADVYLGGPDAVWGRPRITSLTFSPDGDLLVYSARGEDSRLYLQRLDQERAEPLAGTEGCLVPILFAGRCLDRFLRRAVAEASLRG